MQTSCVKWPAPSLSSSSLLMSPGAEHMRQSVIADRLDQPEGPDDEMPIVMAVVDVPGGQWTVSSAQKGTQVTKMSIDCISSVYGEMP